MNTGSESGLFIGVSNIDHIARAIVTATGVIWKEHIVIPSSSILRARPATQLYIDPHAEKSLLNWSRPRTRNAVKWSHTNLFIEYYVALISWLAR